MDALNCIYTRVSTRKYIGNKTIEKCDMDKILMAACSSPSACNRKSFEFIVVEKTEIIEKLICVSGNYLPLKNASAVIVVVFETKNTTREYNHHDCAAATQNILLAANAIGIASCWCGGLIGDKNVERLKDVLNIPKKITVVSLIALGYCEQQEKKERQIIANKIHYNSY